jgi:hypothetical protein
MPRLVARGLTADEFARITATTDRPVSALALDVACTLSAPGDLVKSRSEHEQSKLPRLSRHTHAVMVVCLCFFLEALTLSSRSFFAVVMDDWQKDFGLSVTAVGPSLPYLTSTVVSAFLTAGTSAGHLAAHVIRNDPHLFSSPARSPRAVRCSLCAKQSPRPLVELSAMSARGLPLGQSATPSVSLCGSRPGLAQKCEHDCPFLLV